MLCPGFHTGGPCLRWVFLAVVLVFMGHRLALGRTPEPGKVRGVIISTHTDGTDWGSPAMRTTMEEIRDLGADWVSIHPYAWIREDGAVRFHEFDPQRPPSYLERPIREAHALGLQILIKPHIGYWGSPFSHRGEIRFDTEEQWHRFFSDYERWITLLVEACEGADAFVVGTELDATIEHESEWRHIIAQVRRVTDVPLTYGANWSHYERVGFWDALDVVGIQAYFPLTPDRDPGLDAVENGWKAIMGRLHEFSVRENRKIAFTELGYNRSFDAAVRPWAYEVDGEEAEKVQELCLRAALEAVEREPSVVGVFLWKWFPNPYPVGRNFQLATPGMRQVISESWGS